MATKQQTAEFAEFQERIQAATDAHQNRDQLAATVQRLERDLASARQAFQDSKIAATHSTNEVRKFFDRNAGEDAREWLEYHEAVGGPDGNLTAKLKRMRKHGE